MLIVGCMDMSLVHGRKCPAALAAIIQQEPSLKEYQWIVAARKGQFEEATFALMENAKQETRSVRKAKQCLALARISNRVLEKQENRKTPWVRKVVSRRVLLEKRAEKKNQCSKKNYCLRCRRIKYKNFVVHTADLLSILLYKKMEECCYKSMRKIAIGMLALPLCHSFEK